MRQAKTKNSSEAVQGVLCLVAAFLMSAMWVAAFLIMFGFIG